jgi:hypothetical protein
MMESNQGRKGITTYWVDESWDEPMPFKYPLGPKNLADVEVDDKGGFIVPSTIAEGVKEYLLTGKILNVKDEESGMGFFETGRWRLNLDQVSDFRYDLDEITKELSAGDIYTVTISINMVNGDQYLLDDLAEMYTFVLMTNKGSRDCVPETKTLGYYLQRSKDYLTVKEAKEKEKA